MIDPTNTIEAIAQKTAQLMGEPWDFISDQRKEKYRISALMSWEQIVYARQTGFEDAQHIGETLLTAPSTPKRWLPGIREMINAVGVHARQEKERATIGAQVPDVLPNGFSDDDPHTELMAGEQDPQELLSDDEQCGATHMGGWTCTRPAHSPTWKHWDADREYMPEVKGSILATWWDAEGDIESLHPVFTPQD